MPSKYVSIREKVIDYIENNILMYLKQKDLDYYKVMKIIIERTGASQSIVESSLKDFINAGKIKHISILTIPDGEVEDWIKELKEMEEKADEMLKIDKKDGKNIQNATKK